MRRALRALPWLILVTVTAAHGERLPVRSYGLADGLPSTFVDHITSDSRGLLWFSTRDGLARFDGARFVTYGIEHGLPIPNVSFVLESRRNVYWVATNGRGVCRMDSEAVDVRRPVQASGTLFHCISLGRGNADRVNVLHEDPSGRIWIGTDGGLYRLDVPTPRGADPVAVLLRDPSDPARPVGVSALMAGDAGEMWVGTGWGLIQLLADGRALPYRVKAAAAGRKVRDIARGIDGRIWVLYQRGLLSIPAAARSNAAVGGSAVHADPPTDGESQWTDLIEGEVGESALLVSANGHVWVGTDKGLLEFDGRRFRRYQTAHGLPERLVLELAEDRDQNLWIASVSGVFKLSRHGLITYDEHDGLKARSIHALFEDASGHVFAVGDDWVVSRFDGTRFASVNPRVPPGRFGWAAQGAFLDRTGAWWILGPTSLGRFPVVQRIEEIDGRLPSLVYPNRDGAVSPTFLQLFEDTRGDIWWSASGEAGGLGRWDRATGFIRYPDVHGQVAGDRPSAFGEDAAGTLWIGFSRGGLIRYDGSRFQHLSGDDVPGGTITAIHRDKLGRLWIGSNSDGLTRVDDPPAERPRFVRYTTEDGLSSRNVRCLASDAGDGIYVGTVRGIDRLDARSGVFHRYTTADGLANGFVTAALHDSNGSLWFGTLDGLSRLVSAPQRSVVPPTTWIEAWKVNGVSQPVSHIGQATLSGAVLDPGQNQVQFDFYGIGFRESGTLRYQYWLEGADRDWSRPSAERVVHYPHLSPGRYQFQVRAITSDGLAGVTPAVVEFVILPPVWQRWWFRTGVVVGMLLLGVLAHRSRVARLLETERVRTRIASDLHDDIGSSLSQIAILSEVARTSASDDARITASLGHIATLSREAVDAMGDIVWAIDPHRDTPGHLAQRMRWLASDLLSARGIEVQFEIADAIHPRLGADVRREVFLIFKEALHNITRHAQATGVEIVLSIAQHRLQLVVQDNGCGFDAARARDGQGLRNMVRRAHGLGGILAVTSTVGTGARLVLSVPL
jgi:signal transduction histidine kinase/ligand-binding sensor domain-containing protein